MCKRHNFQLHANCSKLKPATRCDAIYFLALVQLLIVLLFQQNYDAIIVRSDTKITADVLASGASGKLKVVGRAGVGVDNIDIEAATKNNVVVLK